MTSEAVSRRRGDLRPGRRARRHRIVDGNDITRTKPDPEIFLRVHRSTIVNLSHVAEIYREGPDEGTVVLRSGQKLKMSKTGRLKLAEFAKL